MKIVRIVPIALLSIVAACGSSSEKAPSVEERVTSNVKSLVQSKLDAMLAAAIDLEAAAPLHAWNDTTDAAKLQEMKDAWRRARAAYESIEGAFAVLFPELDASTDARYDDFLSELGRDDDLFDGEGVTGMHAIERVLWAKTIPAAVVEFESKLPGYKAAVQPATDDEAKRFKQGLCAKFVSDARAAREGFAPLALDLSYAFRGTIGLVGEQVEKVEKAATGEEESRYAQLTMTDLRSNLAGNEAIYAAFRPWIVTKQGGDAIDQQINDGFARLEKAYGEVTGEAIPSPPATWSSEPTEADLLTPFGKLHTAVTAEADPKRAGSVVNGLDAAAKTLGLRELAE